MNTIFKLLILISTLYFSAAISATTNANYNCQDNTQISTEQCETLVSIYNNTDGENWVNADTHLWLKNSKPCEWEGIACNGNQVIRLELFELGLKGQLPPLNGLSSLEQIGVFNNPELTGSLPDLVPLKNLTKINAFNTGLTGFLPDPQYFPQLTQLVVHNSRFIGPIPDAKHLISFVAYGNQLCQSPRIDYTGIEDIVEDYPICTPMLTDTLFGRLNVSQYGAIPDDDENDHNAINHALNMIQLSLPPAEPLSNLTVYFPTGTYKVEKSIKLSNFEQLTIVGDKNDLFTSRLVKGSLFGNNINGVISELREGAIFDFSFGSGLTVKYISVTGQLPSTTTPSLWWDHGFYIGSTHSTNISNNQFLNMGDSALLITTDPEEKSNSINSSDILVNNNYFYNIRQISTTSVIGGSSHYSFVNNTVEHIKGSVKFATRLEGAAHIRIMNNTITSAGVDSGISTNNGFEIEGYKHIHISNNTLKNGNGVGIVVRSSQSAKTQSAFDWQDVMIMGNTISNYRQAIYISNLPHSADGSLATASNIVVSDNHIENLWNGDNQAAIHFVGSQFESCRVQGNTIIGGQYAVWPEVEQDWLQLEGNILK